MENSRKVSVSKFLDFFKLSLDEEEIGYDDYEEQCIPSVKTDKKLDKYLNARSETFSRMLLRIIDKKGFNDSEVYKRANVDRRLFSKIRSNPEYVPSRKTVISFCLALRLEMYEAEQLMKSAGYAFSRSSKFDLIIMYLIENGEYNINFANVVLNDYGERSLSK